MEEGNVEEERKHPPEEESSSEQHDFQEEQNSETALEDPALPGGKTSREKRGKPWYNTKRSLRTGAFFILVLLTWWYFQNSMVQNAGLEDQTADAVRPSGGRSLAGTSFYDPVPGMNFIGIPKGCFIMGSPASEKNRRSNEGPQHEVCVDGFSMSRYEATLGSWHRFIKETGYVTDAEKNKEKAGCFSIKDGAWGYQDGRYWDNVGFPQSDNQPVVCVSHNDVEKYIEWLDRKTGRKYRLPTEAEWEYAARAGSTTSRFWGEGANEACQYGNVADKSYDQSFQCDDGYKWTSPVGRFKANAFGLYDMLGNVWEWTNDYYGNDYYRDSPHNNPTGPRLSMTMVNRGGGWACGPKFIRAAVRVWIQPWARSSSVGFRLVLAPKT